MRKVVLRVRPDSGEIYILERDGNGNFVLGDPVATDKKHHEVNSVEVETLQEAIELIQKGFHPRMRGVDTNQWNMISPKNVRILEVPK